MPLYNYNCTNCGATQRRLLDNETVAKAIAVICRECGEFMERMAVAPSARVTEVLDNGVMVRKVERIQDAEQIYKDRSRQQP